MDNKYVIAIDGFAGTGKGTTAKLLSKKLGIMQIDSGAMYRAGGYYAWKNNIDINDVNIEEMLKSFKMEVKFIQNCDEVEQHVYINGEDFTPFLRSKEANEYSSKIAVIGIYRKKMTEIFRSLSKEHSVVMDGRDITTVVFPNAEVKLFLTANIDIRVKRRMLEYQQKGEYIDEKTLRENMLERDERDTTRAVDPMKIVEDAIVVDTSDKTIDEVVDIAYNIVKEKVGKQC